MATTIQAVIFDLDNTLYPHRQYVEGAFLAMAQWIAQRVDADAASVRDHMLETWEDHSQRYDSYYRRILDRYALAGDENEAELRRIYHSQKPSLTPFQGAADLLKRLAVDYRLGLLTDGWAPTQRRKLAALDLAAHFHAIVFTGDLGREYYKPHSRGYRMVLNQLDAEPEQAVFVGDNPETDIRGARDLGLWTIRILQGEYREMPDAADAPPHRVCRELSELAEQLADLSQGAGGRGRESGGERPSVPKA